MCVCLLSRVPPSCLLASSLLFCSEPPWALHSLSFWPLPSLFTSSFPYTPHISLQGEADISSSSFHSSHTLLSSLWVFMLPVDLHPHPYSVSLSPPRPKVTTNPVPCLPYISLFFFLLQWSSGESLTFVHACGCRTVQPAHKQTIICHANTEAPGGYSSHSFWLRHGNPHFKLSIQIKRRGLAISHA